MSQLDILIEEVAIARNNFITAVSGLSYEQAGFRPDTETWSVIDNVEHLFWAEFGGINGMGKAIDGIKTNKPLFTGEPIHQGLAIETIIEKTWRERETVPEIAKPRMGGSLSFWVASLQNCQGLLLNLKSALGDIDPEQVVHPQPISGPLNILQRMQFLRFHLQRHQHQVERIITHPGFPVK